MKIAFIGFRHNHIMGLYDWARRRTGIQLVAACEEDPATRDQLRSAGKVQVTHTDYRQMLADVPCDAIAIGDYFGKRGQLAIAALAAGKHVLSDKPLCTHLSELDQIEHLLQKTSLRLGCLLDLRDHPVYRTMRRIIRAGAIGDIQTLSFSAQHPLLPGKRPDWYFDPAKHGGTLNDIAIHAIDLIPWLTGHPIAEILAVRTWPAQPSAPHFPAGGQLMLRLANHAGVLGDVSYLSPDALAYSAEQYWRLTCHGTSGVIEGRYNSTTLSLATSTDTTPQQISADEPRKDGVIEDFLLDITNQSPPDSLTTQDILSATRRSLELQSLANSSLLITH